MSTWPIPLALVFGVVSALLVRGRAVRTWEATVITLFGFYLAESSVGQAVSGAVGWLLRGFLHT